MTTDVQDILKAARALPAQGQLELLQGLVQSLAQSLSPLANTSGAFWRAPSIEELASERHVGPVTDVRTLAMPDWPADEAADDLIGFVREQRRADRTA